MLQVPATVRQDVRDGELAVHLIDISRAGVAFASTRPLENGSSFALTFWLPGAAQPSTAEGLVVYCMAPVSGELFRVGARLTAMSRETQEQVMDFVTEPLARQAGLRTDDQLR